MFIKNGDPQSIKVIDPKNYDGKLLDNKDTKKQLKKVLNEAAEKAVVISDVKEINE